MKACPFCEAELRDSVIKCARCGSSLLAEPEPSPEHRPVPASATSPALGAPTVSGGTRGSKVGFPRQDPAAPAAPAAWATPSTLAPGSSGDSMQKLAGLRALPSDRRRTTRPDFAMLLAAAAAIGAAAIAWRSIGDPWVKLIITDTSDRLDPQLVGDITLHGHAALVGVIGQGLAAALGVFGILWLFYGVNRGSTVPWFANPAGAILVSISALIGALVSAMVWFVWEDSAVKHARAVRMTVDELNALLHLQPEPLVQIQRLSGLMRFGGAMVVGLLAASTAWWSSHQRS